MQRNYTTPSPPPELFRLPSAVQSAELLRGSLVPCGPTVRPVGWPDSARVRAIAVHDLVRHKRLAVVLETAAWVWGAAWRSTQRIECSTLLAKRFMGLVPFGVSVHEFNIDPSEIHFFDNVAVTTPLRTAYDILYSAAEFTPVQREACRVLAARVDGGVARIGRRLITPRRPYLMRAQARLEEVRASTQ